MPYLLTSPSSRGIGLALTVHLLRTTTLPVIATARTSPSSVKASILSSLPSEPSFSSRLTVLPLDVTDESSIVSVAEHLTRTYPSTHCHAAFLTPGILPITERSPAQISAQDTHDLLTTNLIGPMLLMKHLSRFVVPSRTASAALATAAELGSSGLSAHRAIYAMMSARVGSTTDNRLGGWYAYRASKAGVNSLVRGLDLWFQGQGGGKEGKGRAIAMALHPGTVRTEFTRDYWEQKGRSMLTAAESAENLIRVVGDKADLDKREGGGKCWDWQGELVPP